MGARAEDIIRLIGRVFYGENIVEVVIEMLIKHKKYHPSAELRKKSSPSK